VSKKSMLLAVVPTLSCFAMAQSRMQQEAQAEGTSPVGDATATCAVTFSSGNDANLRRATQLNYGSHSLLFFFSKP
jgi:spore coat protein U-like protein